MPTLRNRRHVDDGRFEFQSFGDHRFSICLCRWGWVVPAATSEGRMVRAKPPYIFLSKQRWNSLQEALRFAGLLLGIGGEKRAMKGGAAVSRISGVQLASR